MDSMIDYAFDVDDSTCMNVDNDQFFNTVMFDDVHDTNISDITLNIEVELPASDMGDKVYFYGTISMIELGWLFDHGRDYGGGDVVSVNYRIETKFDEADDRTTESLNIIYIFLVIRTDSDQVNDI